MKLQDDSAGTALIYSPVDFVLIRGFKGNKLDNWIFFSHVHILKHEQQSPFLSSPRPVIEDKLQKWVRNSHMIHNHVNM